MKREKISGVYGLHNKINNKCITNLVNNPHMEVITDFI